MRLPSGDQLGDISHPEASVSRVWSEPSVFITYMSVFPSRSDANAMRPPATAVAIDVSVAVGVVTLVELGMLAVSGDSDPEHALRSMTQAVSRPTT